MGVEDFVAEAAKAFQARLVDLVGTYGIPEGDPAALGDRAALTSAAAEVWTAHVGPFVDAAGAARLLSGVSRQAVSQRVRSRRLLGLRTGSGRVVFPLWQFAAGAVLDGLPEVLTKAGYDPDRPPTGWTIASWLCTDDPGIGGQPRRLLAAGHRTRVVALAGDLRAELGVDERRGATADSAA